MTKTLNQSGRRWLAALLWLSLLSWLMPAYAQATTVDLALTGTDTENANGGITDTLTVTNNGPATATGVTITAYPPNGTTLGSGTSSDCSGIYPVTCTISGSLTPGASATEKVTYLGANPQSIATRLYTANALQNDANTANNSLTLSSTGTSADLVLTGTDTENANGGITDTLTVTNNGPATATGVTITANLPNGTTLGSGTSSDCSGAYPITCTISGSLTPGASATENVTYLGANPQSTTTRFYTANTLQYDANTANNSLTFSSTGTSADLSLTGTGTENANGGITDTLTVTNNGPATATGVTITANLPNGTTLGSGTSSDCTGAYPITCIISGSLTPGASATEKVTYLGANPQSTTTRFYTANTLQYDANTANNSLTLSSTGTSADLVLTGTGTENANGGITDTLTVTNNGPATATSVTITANLPNGTTLGSGTSSDCSGAYPITCIISGSLTPGASATENVTYLGANPQSTTTRFYTANTLQYDANTANNSLTLSSTGTSADLSLTGTGTENANGGITDTLTVTNNGPATATSVTITANLPYGTTLGSGTSSDCTGAYPITCIISGSLTPGASATEKVTYLGANPQSTTTRLYTANALQYDANTANNNLMLSSVGPFIDLALSGSGSQIASHLATDTLTVANAGPATATGITVTTTLPSGVSFVAASSSSGCTASAQAVSCTVQNLAAGANSSLTVAAQAPTTQNSLSLGFTVAAASNLTDTNPANNTTTIVAAVSVDLSLAGSGTETSTGLATDRLTISNLGGLAATAVTITTTLPSGVSLNAASSNSCTASGQAVTCTIGSLGTGASSSLTVVAQGPATLGSLPLTFTANAAQPDSNPANNAVTVTTQNPSLIDLSLSGSGTENSAGLAIDTLMLKNSGPAGATATVVTTTLPSNVNFVLASSSSGCAASGQSVTCAVANLAANASATVMIGAQAPATLGSLPLTFTASAAQIDGNPANNAVTVTTQNPSLIDLSLNGSGTETYGGLATDTLTLTNAGPAAASSIVVVSTLPGGVSFVSASSSSGCSANGQSITCSVSSLAANASTTLSVAAQDSSTNTSLSLAFAASAAQPDTNPANNSATVITQRASATDLVLSGIGTETAKGLATDNLTVLNQGPGSDTGVVITGTLPSGVSFVSGSSSSGCSGSSGSVTCTIGSLADNASATVKVVLQALSTQTSLSVPFAVTGAGFDPDTSNNSATVTTYTSYLSYSYDGNGFISKRAPAGGTATYMFYSKGGQLLGEYDSSGTAKRENIYLGHALVAYSNAGITSDGSCTPTGTSTPTYTVTDPLGSPVAASDFCGGMAWTQPYYPFGNRQAFPALGQSDQWFTGKYQDDLTQLVDMGARQYSPSFGRFMSIDPAAVGPANFHSFNRYEYANNNPYRYVDPNGKLPQEVVDFAAGFGDVLIATATLGIDDGGEIRGAYGNLGNVDTNSDAYKAGFVSGVVGTFGLGRIAAGAEADVADTSTTSQGGDRTGTAGGARAGKPFTAKGKAEIDADNAARNGGVNVCENCGTQVVPGQKSQAGVTPPGNERQRDHIIPRSAGGDGDPSNGQVLCRDCNIHKSDNMP